MSPFLLLLLVVASIWTRLSDCAIILESPTSDDTSLAIDPSNLFDPGTSVLDPKVAAIDKESKLSTDGELTPTYDCFSYNVPFKSRLRVRECDPTNLRTRPENESDGETDTTPEGHSGRDFQPPNEENKTPSDQGEAEPEKEPGGLPTNVSAQNPWAECRKYLRGLLKYAVCDNPDPNYTHYQPLPLLYLNAPFWTLFHCTLGKLVHCQEFWPLKPFSDFG